MRNFLNLTIWAIFLLAAFGWVANIFKLASNLSDPITTLFVARCVGLFFAPLGAVLGFV